MMQNFTYLPTQIGENTIYTSSNYPDVSVTIDRKHRVTITYKVKDGTQNIFDYDNLSTYVSADRRLEELFQRGFNAMQGHN